MVTIVQKEDPILRKTAEPVSRKNIGGPGLAKVLKDMKKALDSQDDGIAIAAPQIGISQRIFIVSGKAFDLRKKPAPKESSPDLICINPEILKLSKKKKSVPEGCLSVRYLYGNVDRSVQTTIKALDEHGNEFTRGASGLLAQIFQHEIDHLNGVLFTDTAYDIEDLPPNHHEHEQM